MTVVGERTVSIGADSARLRMWALQRGVLPALAPAGIGFELLAGSTAWPTLLDRVALLSAREMEVFLLLGVGASNRTIASGLSVAERTVKAHVAQVMAKLAVESRLQAGLVSQVFRMTYEGALSIEPPD
jgi:DNA-binding CsgD family transcriptional regulator